MSTLHPVTTYSRKRQHLAKTLNPSPRGGNSGDTLCHEEGYDQALVDAERVLYGWPGAVVADLPLCRKCEKSAERLRGES